MADSNNLFLNAFEKAARSVSGFNETIAQIEKTNARHAMHHNCIGFYEPYENCGMTTAIINIAAVLASKNYTVCIVDLNVDKPDVYRYLREEGRVKERREQTIRDKLLNNARPAVEVANKTKLKNVWYISSRFDEHPINYSGNNDGDTQINQIKDALLTLFAELAVVYDFVFLDIPSKITDVFSITGLAGSDIVYTFHDGTIRTTEVMLKNERILQSIGFEDVFCNIVQSKIYSDDVKLLSSDFKLVNPKSVLVMNIPYCESVATIGQGSGIFMYQSHEKTKVPTAVRSKYRQLADQIIEATKTGFNNVVNVESEHHETVSIVNNDMDICSFTPLDGSEESRKRASAQQKEEESAIRERIRERIEAAEKEREYSIQYAEQERLKKEAEEKLERERKKALLEAQLAEAERRNAEREKKAKEEEMLRRAKAAARGIEIENNPEFEIGEDLIKTPNIIFKDGKIVEVKKEGDRS